MPVSPYVAAKHSGTRLAVDAPLDTLLDRFVLVFFLWDSIQTFFFSFSVSWSRTKPASKKMGNIEKIERKTERKIEVEDKTDSITRHCSMITSLCFQ